MRLLGFGLTCGEIVSASGVNSASSTRTFGRGASMFGAHDSYFDADVFRSSSRLIFLLREQLTHQLSHIRPAQEVVRHYFPPSLADQWRCEV